MMIFCKPPPSLFLSLLFLLLQVQLTAGYFSSNCTAGALPSGSVDYQFPGFVTKNFSGLLLQVTFEVVPLLFLSL